MNPDAVSVRAIGGSQLEIAFSNGEIRRVEVRDLTPFDGVFEPLNDPDFFRQVSVNSELGTVVWPNDADLCPDMLYENSVICTGQQTKVMP